MLKNTRNKFNFTLFRERRRRGDTIALYIASFFGAGFSPWMPGTVGTLAALPFIFLLQQSGPLGVQIFLILALIPIASFAAFRADWTQKTRDHGSIVIDEFLGFWITCLLNGPEWTHWFAAFVAFRFFDILKLPPVRWFDTRSKGNTPGESASFTSGFWVIADDLVAGLQGLVTMTVLFRSGILS